MRKIEFRLTMPNNNSWNGKWSGEGKDYLIYKSLTDEQFAKLNGKSSWYYNFGDGWGANVSMRDMKGERKKKSSGFCGYDWMVNSILSCGEILTSKQRIESGLKQPV